MLEDWQRRPFALAQSGNICIIISPFSIKPCIHIHSYVYVCTVSRYIDREIEPALMVKDSDAHFKLQQLSLFFVNECITCWPITYFYFVVTHCTQYMMADMVNYITDGFVNAVLIIL